MTDEREAYEQWRVNRTTTEPETPAPVAAPDAYTQWRQSEQERATERAALIIEQAPDRGVAVEAHRLSAESGGTIPPELLTDVTSQLAQRIEQQSRRQQLMGSSRLAGWVSQDPMNAALAQMELRNLGTAEGLLNSLGRGFDQAITGWWRRRDVRRSEDRLAELQTRRLDMERGFGGILQDIQDNMDVEDFDQNIGYTIASTYAQALDRFISSRLTFVGDETLDRQELGLATELEAAFERQAANSARIDAAYGRSTQVAFVDDQLAGIGDIEGLGAQTSALAQFVTDNPGAFTEWLANVVIESAPGLTAAMATTAVTRRPSAGAAVLGATSFAVGESTTFDTLVAEAGYDLRDPAQRLALVNNPEFRMQLRDRAFAYGAVVGLMDAASGGVASQTLVRSPAGDLVLQSLTQAAMGSGGETLALLASGQNLNMVDILVEGIAEFATAPVEVAGVGGRYLQGRRQAIEDAAFFDALGQNVEESQLRTDVPERYRDALNTLTADGPVESVFVDARQLDELFQSGSVTTEEFLRAVPGVSMENFRQARDTGGVVEIPTSSYATDIVGTEFDGMLREHLKTAPDRMSLAEARAYREQTQELAELANNAVAEIESGQQELERVAEDARVELVSMLRRAGRTSDVAEREALQAVAFARTMADRLGVTMDEFLRRYPLAEVQGVTSSPLVSEETTLSQGSVSSNAFKAWFGDSQVVDSEGAPLVMYHGTTPERAGFEAFDASQAGSERDAGFYGKGLYFTPDEDAAFEYATNEEGDEGQVYSTYLSVTNPYVLDLTEAGWSATRADLIRRGFSSAERAEDTPYGGATYILQQDEPSKFSNQLMAEGFDGVIVRTDAEAISEVVVFEPTQIKSVGNRGTFDADDPRILFQSAPEGDAFQAWAGTDDPVIDPEDVNDTDFRGEGPWVVRVYHGTTHTFEQFDASVSGNKEGQFGAVNYFTTSFDDASGNYGADGPDLTARMENARERAENELEFAIGGLTEEDAIIDAAEEWVVENYPDFDTGSLDSPSSDDIAEAEDGNVLPVAQHYAAQVVSQMNGGEEQVLEVFVRTEKPFVVGGDANPFIEFSDFEALEQQALERVADDEGLSVEEVQEQRDEFEDAIDEARWEIEAEELNALVEAIQNVADRYDIDASELMGDIAEFSAEGGTHTDLEALLRQSETLAYAEDPDSGDVIGYHILAEVIQELGFDSIILKDANERFSTMDMEAGTAHVHVFDSDNTNVKSVDNRGTFDRQDPRILYQQDDNKRGSIRLPEGEGTAPLVTFFEKADLSTFLHESAHYYLHVFESVATQEGAPAQLVDDFAAVKDWWRSNAAEVATEAGVSERNVKRYLDSGTTANADMDKAIGVALQEQWARGYEAYLLEGKAPSNALRTAFEAFSAWLVNVYRQARGLNVQINDELRGVFDRLLATDAEIAAARDDADVLELAAQSAEKLGLDKSEYDNLVQLSREAQEEARQSLMRDIMAPIRRAKTEQYKAERAEVEAEVRASVERKPANRVREWIGNSRWLGDAEPQTIPDDLRLDRDMLVEEFGEDILKQLPRGRRTLYTKGSGLTADDVAGWFGYNSGAEMVADLVSSPKAEAEIKSRTDAEMRKRHGDPLGDGSVEDAAIKAVNGEKKGQLIAAELRAIGKTARKDKITTRSQAAEIARRTIRSMPMRKAVRSNQYLAAERRAAERAATAVAKGDMEAAFNAKREQLVNHALYRESRKADEVLSKVEGRVAKLKSKGTRKNLAGEYLDAIDDILTSYDFRKSISQKAERKRAGLLAYVEMMKQEGRENELAIPSSVLDEAQRKPYRQLTVAELEGVYDALRNIEHTARMKQKLRDAQAERDLAAVVEGVTGEMDANLTDAPRNRVATPGDKAKAGVREFANLLLNADTLLRKIGGFDRGQAYEAIKAPIDAAADWASVEREKAGQAFEDLYAVFDKKTQRRMAVRQHIPELNGSFNRWDLISMALNMGNADNLNRLTDKDSGVGFTPQQVDFVKRTLTKEEWDFVQSAWDYIGSFWPLIEARERRLTGVAPKRVQATEVETPYGTYAGGYYPIKYDGDLSGMVAAEELADVQQRMLAGRFGKAQTSNGHLEERAQGSGGRALQLGIEVMHQHVGQVIHDLAFSEVVSNSWRVLQDPRVRGAFERKGLLKDHQTLEIWLQDTATGQLSAGGVFGRLALRAKNGFTLSKLAFNMSTVMLQLTGVTQSAVVVGNRNLALGYSDYLSNPQRAAQDVMDRSPFMRERETTFNRDINDILGDVARGPAASRAQRFQQGLGRVGFWMMQKTQFYGVDVPTWYAGYRQGLQKFGNDEAKAAQHADRMVARAQASGIFSDRSAFERGTLSADTRQNGFVRLFTALGSYMFAKGNIAYEVAGRTARDIDGLNLRSLQAAIKGAVDMGLLFTVEAIAYHLIKGTLPGMDDDDSDDDSWGAFLARETALSMMSTVPGVRDMGSSISGFEAGAYGSVISTFTRPMIQAAQGEADLPLFKALSNAVGVMTGLPSGQLNKTVDAWYRLENGDDIAPVEFLMGASR